MLILRTRTGMLQAQLLLLRTRMGLAHSACTEALRPISQVPKYPFLGIAGSKRVAVFRVCGRGRLVWNYLARALGPVPYTLF